MWPLILGISILLLAAFLYWAFVVTEGAYLGARVVAWTYDLAAHRYDQIKQFRDPEDAWLLARPLLEKLGGVDAPLILDVATGTGRMPLALLKRALFQGYVVGLDLSHKMLQQARKKLGEGAGRYVLVWRDAQRLAFPDDTFDAVCCLEAIEFMPSPRRVLSEMVRVLRPGGVFLVTNRINWERKLMPGKAFTDDRIRAMLQETGLVEIDIRPWQTYYDLIWTRKAGTRSRLGRGTQELGAILCCPKCHHSPLAEAEGQFRCRQCGSSYPVEDSIVHMAR